MTECGMTFVELTARYRDNSRARRMLRHYALVLDAFAKSARLVREERQERWAGKLDDKAHELLEQARQHCECLSMPVTGEVMARSHEDERRESRS